MKLYKDYNGLWYFNSKTMPAGSCQIEWVNGSENPRIIITPVNQSSPVYYDGDCTSLQKEDKSYYGSVQDFKENCNGFFIKASASGGSTSGVSSVAGKSGDVTLTKNDVGLSNVNNTSDLDKPISTETQRILNDTVAQVRADLNDIVRAYLYIELGGNYETNYYNSSPDYIKRARTINWNGAKSGDVLTIYVNPLYQVELAFSNYARPFGTFQERTNGYLNTGDKYTVLNTCLYSYAQVERKDGAAVNIDDVNLYIYNSSDSNLAEKINNALTPYPKIFTESEKKQIYRNISILDTHIITPYNVNNMYIQGYYATASGVLVTSAIDPLVKKYISSNVEVTDGYSVSLNMNDGYLYRLFYFAENNNFIGYSDWYDNNITETGLLNNTYKIGVSFKKLDGTDFLVSNYVDAGISININSKSDGVSFSKTQVNDLIVNANSNKFCHISFDDVHALWQDLVTNQSTYTSIFSNRLLGWIKSMHDQHGIVCTLILDYIEDLSAYPVPSKFRQEFIDNLDWLKLGFQAKNNKDYRLETYANALSDYNEFSTNVFNTFGTFEIIDRVIRNNFFHSNINVANGLRDAKCGAIGFLGCDDWSYNSTNRIINCYLTSDQSTNLDKKDRYYDYINDFWIFKTDFRFEEVSTRWSNINACIADYDSLNRANEAYDLIVFTHESYFESLKEMMQTFLSWAKNKGYSFDFPMNKILR